MITIRTNEESGDWVEVWIDSECIYAGHAVYQRELYEILLVLGHQVTYKSCTNKEMEEGNDQD